MLKGWNKKVRITTAIISACTITRITSASPPSFRFAPVCTLMRLLSHSAGENRLCAPRSCNLWGTRAQLHAGIRRGSRCSVLARRSRRLGKPSMTEKDFSFAARGQRPDDNEGLGHRTFIRNGQLDARLVSGGCHGLEAPFGAPGQFHGGPP